MSHTFVPMELDDERRARAKELRCSFINAKRVLHHQYLNNIPHDVLTKPYDEVKLEVDSVYDAQLRALDA